MTTGLELGLAYAIETADRVSPTGVDLKTVGLHEKIVHVRDQMCELAKVGEQFDKHPYKQLSLADPDARSMLASGKGAGIVGYEVQAAMDTKHHLIVEHEVTNVGNDHGRLSKEALSAKNAMGKSKLKVVADRGYFSGPEILACDQNEVSAYVPKPRTSA
ncbi:transposase IS4 family protein [Caballeronia hypogeia]|uniref:Transposase IS4 family protein n=1 Tax=Caballeronia hypogeia TaxID=1777140 RepID=A0A158DRN0_9BURK|nr:transposase IS4 family protein [Caballeronia hypogeia]